MFKTEVIILLVTLWARKFNVSGETVKDIWVNFCESGNVGPGDEKKKGSQNPPHWTEAEFEVIEVLKRTVPWMLLEKIQDVIETPCNVNGGTSHSSIRRAIRFTLLTRVFASSRYWIRMSLSNFPSRKVPMASKSV